MKKKSDTAILLLSCPDRPGIVAQISHFISANFGNIIRSDQHSDEESEWFFMRIEWDLANFAIERNKIAEVFSPIADRFKMEWKLDFSAIKTKIAVMVSAMDHCFLDLLLRKAAGELDDDIALVISNHEDLRPLAENYGIAFHCLPVTAENKKEQETKTLALLEENKIGLIVLARYMQILSPLMVEKYPSRIINIHHSFLPAFIGAKPYHQAHARGVKIIGATSHYVTSDLDQGPIIEQDVIRISHKDSIDDLIQKGKNLEKNVLSRGVKLHCQHKVLVYRNKTVVFD